jgi:2-keto-4-pentenoate hydratase/2-oxohepta-3-ene-1,7-dioic acid hydratase in catechol pathway
MRFKIVVDKEENQLIAIEQNSTWKIIQSDINILECLDKKELDIAKLTLSEYIESEYQEIIPFRPTAYRDFMLYEKHAIDAARGFVKKYMSHLLPIVHTYEKIFKKPFPKLKPKKRYYQHPIYYMGNHLNFISNNDSIAIPSYTEELDYELELAAVIIKPLKNASIEEVNHAIGGYLILNDFSARDVQLDEMASGFGPMKTKNFGSAISSIIVSKAALNNRLDDLKVKVIINNKTIVETDTKGKLYSFQEAIAYASWEEQLHPGEIFGSGTIPTCTGIENGVMLNKGDTITLEVEGIGQLTNNII